MSKKIGLEIKRMKKRWISMPEQCGKPRMSRHAPDSRFSGQLPPNYLHRHQSRSFLTRALFCYAPSLFIFIFIPQVSPTRVTRETPRRDGDTPSERDLERVYKKMPRYNLLFAASSRSHEKYVFALLALSRRQRVCYTHRSDSVSPR